MKFRIKTLSIVSFLMIICITSNSCTIQKRVHRKGWYISWNKNYKSSSEQKTDAIAQGNNSIESVQDKKESTENYSEEITESKGHSEHLKTEEVLSSSVDDQPTSIEHQPSSQPTIETAEKEVGRKNIAKNDSKSKSVPLGGPFLFLGFSLAIGISALALGGLGVSIGAFIISLVAITIIIVVDKINKGRMEGYIRPSGFYMCILFITLFAVIAALVAVYGGLGSITGIVAFTILLLLIGLLSILAYALNSKDYIADLQEKEAKEKEVKEKNKNLSAEEKRKQRIGGLILGGLVLALFLTIGLLSN